MENFWDYNVWGALNIFAVLLLSLLLGNMIKKAVPVLRASLIPTAVIGGCVILIFEGVYKLITGNVMFETAFFGENGTATLEVITYHALALGFIASALKDSGSKLTKQRNIEIFNTGVTTVATYLLQAILGFGITMIACLVIDGFFPAAGVLLPFGFGQGTGQALNYGNIYEVEHGFIGGKSFGLTVAALGFISAALGGVIRLAYLKSKNRIKADPGNIHFQAEDVEAKDEIPMMESVDKLTIQVALVIACYFLTFWLMKLLGSLLPGMKSVIFGFNFLLGVLTATIMKALLKLMKKKGITKHRYTNSFLLTRTSNFFFDLMVVAGIAAIRLSVLQQYWGILLILGIVGLLSTFAYNYYVAKKLFPAYKEEQFLAMYGMLTGTASTGIMLLREIDGNFKTPVADNLVYQNFPAIVFGFPMMLLATLAPKQPALTMIILVLFFIVMNIILFRSMIFKRNKK
ncbi:MAG: hypothetical protein IJN10_02240 [Firmicutes bacterium]|nr:hypothetical protein [Bacillota bacterium]